MKTDKHRDEIAQRLQLCLPRMASKWTEKTTLAELALDSMDTVELLCTINEEFEVRLREEDFSPQQTLGGLVEIIARRTPQQPTGVAHSALTGIILGLLCLLCCSGCITGHVLQRNQNLVKAGRNGQATVESWLFVAGLPAIAGLDIVSMPLWGLFGPRSENESAPPKAERRHAGQQH